MAMNQLVDCAQVCSVSGCTAHLLEAAIYRAGELIKATSKDGEMTAFTLAFSGSILRDADGDVADGGGLAVNALTSRLPLAPSQNRCVVYATPPSPSPPAAAV